MMLCVLSLQLTMHVVEIIVPIQRLAPSLPVPTWTCDVGRSSERRGLSQRQCENFGDGHWHDCREIEEVGDCWKWRLQSNFIRKMSQILHLTDQAVNPLSNACLWCDKKFRWKITFHSRCPSLQLPQVFCFKEMVRGRNSCKPWPLSGQRTFHDHICFPWQSKLYSSNLRLNINTWHPQTKVVCCEPCKYLNLWRQLGKVWKICSYQSKSVGKSDNESYFHFHKTVVLP